MHQEEGQRIEAAPWRRGWRQRSSAAIACNEVRHRLTSTQRPYTYKRRRSTCYLLLLQQAVLLLKVQQKVKNVSKKERKKSNQPIKVKSLSCMG
jgi:predicted metal-dependent hydrolase